ncbi:MAG: hypothetical protein PVH88_03165 [Ignavibacteria bacterium]|jgi:hypothetical protein
MKKIISLFFVFILVSNAQEISGGMGISYFNNSTLTDYINGNYASGGEKLSTFNSQIDFYIETAFDISENYQLAVEYDFSLWSYTNSSFGIGNYEFTLKNHKPSLLGYYVIKGMGYNFKFGAGTGLRIANVTQKISPTETDYSSTGVGFVSKVQGNTLLGGNFYANIAFEARYDMPGEPEDGGSKITNNSLKENVTASLFSVGLKLGVTYIF